MFPRALVLSFAALICILAANAVHVEEQTVVLADGKPASRVTYSSHRPGLRAPTEFFRIGTVQQIYGPNAAFSTLQFNAWRLFLNATPSFVINGVEHGVKLVSYVDGSGVESTATTLRLTEALIFEDEVHVLTTGFQGNSLTMINAADAYGVPCINNGFYDASFAPPFNWTLLMLPNLANLGRSCVEPLTLKGARTYAIMAEPASLPGAGGVLDIWRAAVVQFGGTIILEQVITEAMKNDPALYDPLIEELRAANPDVVIGNTGGGDGVSNEIARIHRFRLKNYNPPGFVSFGVGSYPVLRRELGFQSDGVLISEAFQPFLNQTDPYWGDTLKYDSAYRAAYNLESGATDAAVAGTITLFVEAFNNSNVNLSAPADILSHMVAVNITSLFGPLFFVNNKVQRTLYCFQNADNGTVVRAVWPNTTDAYTPLVYPSLIEYPKGWLEKFSKKKSHTLTIALSVTFGVLALLVIIGVIIFFVVQQKYHLVALRKGGTKGVDDTWA